MKSLELQSKVAERHGDDNAEAAHALQACRECTNAARARGEVSDYMATLSGLQTSQRTRPTGVLQSRFGVFLLERHRERATPRVFCSVISPFAQGNTEQSFCRKAGHQSKSELTDASQSSGTGLQR